MFEEGHIALLRELPSEEAQKDCRIPHVTCASPLCPSFDKFIEAGSIIVAIEPKKNLAMPYIPFKPIAGLDEVHDSPLDGSHSWRGMGEHNALWFHLTCLEAHSTHARDPLEPRSSEFLTLNQPLAAQSRLIQPDPRPFISGTQNIHPDTPSLQTIYKWQGVVQLEKALAFEDDNEGFYINNDEDAAYLVERHSKFRGGVEGIRVETTGAQARGQLLSVLLRHIASRKTEALKRKAETASSQSYVEFAMTIERRLAQLEEEEGQEKEDPQTAAGNTLAGPTAEGLVMGQEEMEASDKGHIEGLEMVQWTLSRPCSSTAAENDNLGDGLVRRYDRTKWGNLSPEDATLIFWNRVPWRLGPPNGQVWVRFPARVVRLSATVPDDASTLASDISPEVGIWPMDEARSPASPPKSEHELPHWEKSLVDMGRFRLTRSESEIDQEEKLLSADFVMEDTPSELDSIRSEDDAMSEANGTSSEADGSMSEVDATSSGSHDASLPDVDGASSDSKSTWSEAS